MVRSRLSDQTHDLRKSRIVLLEQARELGTCPMNFDIADARSFLRGKGEKAAASAAALAAHRLADFADRLSNGSLPYHEGLKERGKMVERGRCSMQQAWILTANAFLNGVLSSNSPIGTQRAGISLMR